MAHRYAWVLLKRGELKLNRGRHVQRMAVFFSRWQSSTDYYSVDMISVLK